MVRKSAQRRPKTTPKAPKGLHRGSILGPFGSFGAFLVHFWPLWAHLGLDFTTLRRARRPKWAPECPEEAHVGPFGSILVTFEAHLGPFWSILATFPRLGRSFLHYLSSHLGRAFLHYLFCFSQMNSSALFVLFFTDVLFGAFRASRSRLAATGGS